jgi:hypothetical protein
MRGYLCVLILLKVRRRGGVGRGERIASAEGESVLVVSVVLLLFVLLLLLVVLMLVVFVLLIFVLELVLEEFVGVALMLEEDVLEEKELLLLIELITFDIPLTWVLYLFGGGTGLPLSGLEVVLAVGEVLLIVAPRDCRSGLFGSIGLTFVEVEEVEESVEVGVVETVEAVEGGKIDGGVAGGVVEGGGADRGGVVDFEGVVLPFGTEAALLLLFLSILSK